MRKALSITKANDLYLVSLLLLVTVGAVAQQVHFSLGLMLTEVVCILLPAWGMLRWQKVAVKSSARLRWPGWSSALISLLLGAAAWQVGILLEVLTAQWFGYTPGLPPNALPQTAGQAVLYFIALAVFAPLCEEFFFRGVLLRSWQRKGVRAALWAGSLLFVFYHLRLQGLLGLIPVAFLLTWLVWRTDSLFSGVLAHFANNALAVLYTVLSLQYPQIRLPFPSAAAAGVGLVVLIAGIWLLRRITPAPPVFEPGEEPAEPIARGIIRTAPRTRALMPLVLAGMIYLFMAGFEFISGRYPELLAEGNLALTRPALTQPLQLAYEIHNPLGAVVGSLDCTLTPSEGELLLTCRQQAEGYQSQQGSSYWQGERYTDTWSAAWNGNSSGLAAYQSDYQGENGARSYRLDVQPGGLTLNIQTADSSHTIGLIPSTLVEQEAPWRLMGLTFRTGLVQKAMFLTPLRYQADLGISGPSTHDLAVTVVGADLLNLPAGQILTWQVKVGREFTAWYEAQAPHRLVKLETQMETYLLK